MITCLVGWDGDLKSYKKNLCEILSFPKACGGRVRWGESQVISFATNLKSYFILKTCIYYEVELKFQ